MRWAAAAILAALVASGCDALTLPSGPVSVPFNVQHGQFALCSTLPNGKGYVYGTSEDGGCPYPLVNPWKTNRRAWCLLEPEQVTKGDPGCSGIS